MYRPSTICNSDARADGALPIVRDTCNDPMQLQRSRGLHTCNINTTTKEHITSFTSLCMCCPFRDPLHCPDAAAFDESDRSAEAAGSAHGVLDECARHTSLQFTMIEHAAAGHSNPWAAQAPTAGGRSSRPGDAMMDTTEDVRWVFAGAA